MNYNILPANKYLPLQISKVFPGCIKITTHIHNGKADFYLLTQPGYNHLQQHNKILRNEIVFKDIDTSVLSCVQRVNSGQYYLVIINNSGRDLEYSTHIEENYEPPIASGIAGTSGLPF
jgi:hypothetical protein